MEETKTMSGYDPLCSVSLLLFSPIPPLPFVRVRGSPSAAPPPSCPLPAPTWRAGHREVAAWRSGDEQGMDTERRDSALMQYRHRAPARRHAQHNERRFSFLLLSAIFATWDQFHRLNVQFLFRNS
jgi:hypothetical protein